MSFDLDPLWKSLRIAALSCVLVFFTGIFFAYYAARLPRAVKGVLGEHLHLSCGGCHLCERCAKLDNEPCRHPDVALPPMEGYGIDVYNTTKPTELKYINGQNTVTYFGIVLF